MPFPRAYLLSSTGIDSLRRGRILLGQKGYNYSYESLLLSSKRKEEVPLIKGKGRGLNYILCPIRYKWESLIIWNKKSSGIQKRIERESKQGISKRGGIRISWQMRFFLSSLFLVHLCKVVLGAKETSLPQSQTDWEHLMKVDVWLPLFMNLLALS